MAMGVKVAVITSFLNVRYSVFSISQDVLGVKTKMRIQGEFN